MRFLVKRIGLLLYGLMSIVESLVNTLLYATCLDIVVPAVDLAVPFYFSYSDKFLKTSYLSNLKKDHNG